MALPLEQFTVVSVLCLVSLTSAAILDVKKFSKELDKLANDGLGVGEMQEHYNSLVSHAVPLDGHLIMAKLKKDLTDKFKSRLDALTALHESVLLSYGDDKQATFAECCTVEGLEYDSKFGTEIDADAACERVSAAAKVSNPRKLTQDVLNTMKTNLQRNPSLKWQYYGSEEGVFTIFPAHRMESCDTYDNRFRPWYVETATPEPKNVVIVIDKSGSMSDVYEGRSLMQIAKDAANSVLGTMNPSDKVGVVMFSDTVEVPPGTSATSRCYGKELAAANSFNVKYLKSFINTTVEFGGTHYDKAFNAAFDLLEASKPLAGDIKRDQVILFLTDGEPTDKAVSDHERKKQIMTTIQQRNLVMSNKVIIMTYGLGDDVGLDFLQDIADQDGSKYGVPRDESAGPIRAGRYVHVSDPNNLRTVMASYYDYFSNDVHSEHFIFSVPYQAASGIGLVTTVGLPVRHNNELKGVVGVDLLVTDITSELTYFRDGQLCYPFVFDGETKAVGRTLVHPQLPIPSVDDTSNIFIHITSFEREDEFKKDVFDVVTKSSIDSGEATYVSKRYLPRGNSEKEGVQVIEVGTTVFWTKIPESPFVVALAIAGDDVHVDLQSQTPSGHDFLYHRIDLVPPRSMCQHFGVEATKEQPVVKFGPESFKDPVKYLEMEEHVFLVHSYSNFMNDDTGLIGNPGFKDEIRDTVQATAKVNGMWIDNDSGVEDYTVMRYIGTEDGVFRQYPGLVINKYYDPTVRPWYLRAKNNKGQITLSAPYTMGTNYIITLSHTLISGNQSRHASSDEVISVMGMDFTLTYFYRLLIASYQQCMNDMYSCFVIDDSGFLVVHKDFFQNGGQPHVFDAHITQHEPDIAQDLINKRVLVKKYCIDMLDIQMQHYYEVAINNSKAEIDNMKSKDPCTKYQLVTIPHSNSFLGIIDRSGSCKSKLKCPCQDSCVTHSSLDCECPCMSSQNLNYNYCEGEFILTREDPPPCPPPIQSPARQARQQTQQAREGIMDRLKRQDQLQECFDPHCQDRESYSDCFGVLSCAWCNTDKDGELDEPYCTDINDVYRDICTYTPGEMTTVANPGMTDAAKGTGSGLSSGAVVGIIFAVIAIIIVSVILIKKGMKMMKEKKEERKLRRQNVNRESEYVAVPSAPPPPSAPLTSGPTIFVPSQAVAYNVGGSQVIFAPPSMSSSTEMLDVPPSAAIDTDADSDHADETTNLQDESLYMNMAGGVHTAGAPEAEGEANTTTNRDEDEAQSLTGSGNGQATPDHGTGENEQEQTSRRSSNDGSEDGSDNVNIDTSSEPLESSA
ncbi:VWFA and cache domain-containing protein 1-like [Ptychodera flava]|uniref:VWFA and cache domain-containing protein 1-like n=1 Tax=Ptychodera flava TaxID=63121 RepID=UPI003969FB4A